MVMGSWGSMMMVAEVAEVAKVVVVVDTHKSTHSVDHQYHHLSVYTKPTKRSPDKTWRTCCSSRSSCPTQRCPR